MKRPQLVALVIGTAVRHPHRTICAWIVIALVSGSVAAVFLRVDTGTTAFLDRDSAEWDFYEETRRTFGSDEYIAVSLAGKEPYDWELLSEIPELSARLAAIDGVRRVDSLSTVPLIREAESDGVETRPAIGAGIPSRASERARLEAAIRSDLIAERFLVSRSGKYIGLSLLLDHIMEGDRASVVREVRHELKRYPAQISGVPIFRTEVNSRTQREMLVFAPLTMLLIVGIGVLAFSSWFVGGVLLASGSVGAVVTLALMAVTGASLSLSTMILPSVLLALGCAYTMHFVVAVRGRAPSELVPTMRTVAPGVLWAGVTTGLGFAAMSTTRIDAIRELAAYGAGGVLVVMVAAISLAPALLSVKRPRDRGGTSTAWIQGFTGHLVRLSVRYRESTVLLWLVLSLAIGVGAMRLNVQTNIIGWFEADSRIRTAYNEIRAHLSGITPVSVVVRSTGPDPVTTREAIRAIEDLREDSEGLPTVGRVMAVSQPLRLVRRAFGGEGLPRSRAEVEQYLLLLESYDQLNDVVARNRQSAQILMRLDSNDSSDVAAIAEWVDSWWLENGIDGYSVQTTGIMYEFARAQNAIAETQIRGIAVAILTISIVLIFALGSVRGALVSLVPNALPIGVGYGAMGLAGVPLDAATVCLGNLALGIAVDDTVHVMRSARGAAGMDGDNPSELFGNMLVALTLTTLCVGVGFAVLAISDFVLIRNLGLVTAGIVSLCWLADVTLLPAILSGGGDRRGCWEGRRGF